VNITTRFMGLIDRGQNGANKKSLMGLIVFKFHQQLN